MLISKPLSSIFLRPSKIRALPILFAKNKNVKVHLPNDIVASESLSNNSATQIADIYDIPKHHMDELVYKYGSLCHGTSTTNLKNQKVEYGWDFKENKLYELERFIWKPSTQINKFF